MNEYGVGYIKMDYNVDTLQGTELHADSSGQGLLEHNRAHLAWLDGLLDRYPKLVIENCGSGAASYAMLLAAITIRNRPGRLSQVAGHPHRGFRRGALEQLACWSYLLDSADADQASFNMVTAMICRNRQSASGFTPYRRQPALRSAKVSASTRRPCASMFPKPCRSIRWAYLTSPTMRSQLRWG